MKKHTRNLIFAIILCFCFLPCFLHAGDQRDDKLKTISKTYNLLIQADQCFKDGRYNEANKNYKEYLDVYEKEVRGRIKRKDFPPEHSYYNRIFNHRLAKLGIRRCEMFLNPEDPIGIIMKLKDSANEGNRLKERYEPVVLTDIPWGNEEGHIGKMNSNAEPEPDYDFDPLAARFMFEVDHGAIYIFDPVNWRILIYSVDGKYMDTRNLDKGLKAVLLGDLLSSCHEYGLHVASDGNIYLMIYGIVNKYTKEGRHVKAWISNAHWDYMKNDTNTYGKLASYYEDMDSKSGMELEFTNAEHVKWKSIFPDEYYLTDGYVDNLRFEIQSGGYEPTKDTTYFRYIGIRKFHPYGYRKLSDGKVVGEFLVDKNIVRFDLLREDSNGNVYIFGYKDGDLIVKYNREGELVAAVKVIGIPYIDQHGNIYNIYLNKDNGVQLIKWTTTSSK